MIQVKKNTKDELYFMRVYLFVYLMVGMMRNYSLFTQVTDVFSVAWLPL